MALSLVGSASARAASCAIPAHQPGDLILVMARSTANPAPAAAGGTVPTWLTVVPAGLANSLSMMVACAVATASNHTTGTWTFTDDMIVLVLRPSAGRVIGVGASSVGNGNNTQTVIYPALTRQDASGASMGIRFGERNFADADLATVPTGWTWVISQPVSTGQVNVAHLRAALAANPTADTVSVPGSNSAYRAVTIEILDGIPVQARSVSGVPSAASFGAILAKAHQKLSVAGVPPTGYVLTITAGTTLATGSQTITRGKRVSAFGAVTAGAVVTTRVNVSGVGSAQFFGIPTLKATIARAVAGVGSAQAFGAPTIKGARVVPVTGVPSAQAFGITAPKASIKVAVAGKTSSQAFGAITTRTGTSRAVAGLGSAQAFGAIKAVYLVHAPGLGSAQTFGIIQLHAEITIPVAGVGSAQQFGSATVGLKARNVWIWPTTYFPSTGGSLCGFVICGDGHTVGGWDYLPASGRVSTITLDPHEVSTLDLEPTLVK